jgi:hypothetical protein
MDSGSQMKKNQSPGNPQEDGNSRMRLAAFRAAAKK